MKKNLQKKGEKCDKRLPQTECNRQMCVHVHEIIVSYIKPKKYKKLERKNTTSLAGGTICQRGTFFSFICFIN